MKTNKTQFGTGVLVCLGKRSQYWLSDVTGLEVSTINRIINGKAEAKISTAIEISNALGCSIDHIISLGESHGVPTGN